MNSTRPHGCTWYQWPTPFTCRLRMDTGTDRRAFDHLPHIDIVIIDRQSGAIVS